MARKLMAFSDLSDREVDEKLLGKLVVVSHPTFENTPALLEVTADEVQALDDLQADVVIVTWQAPGSDEETTYHLLKEDFDALARHSDMDAILANAQRAKKPGTNGDAAKIRAWAQEQGMEVTSKGRVPAPIVEAYEKAHKA